MQTRQERSFRRRRVLSRYGLPAMAAALVVAAACSDSSHTSHEGVGRSEQRADSVAQRALTLTVPLPEGVRLSSLTLGASQTVKVADRGQIRGLVLANEQSAEVGNDARVAAIWAGGDVQVRDRSSVDGDLRAGGSAQVSSSAQVGGSTHEGGGQVPVSLRSWTVFVPEGSAGPVLLEPNTSRDLEPNSSWGQLSVRAGASIRLHSGVYYFESVTLESGSSLVIDDSDGPVQIYVQNGFIHRGSIRASTYGVPRLFVGVLGTQQVMIEAPFTGALFAPQASVRLQAARPEGHRGTFFGRDLSVEPDTNILGYPLDWRDIVGIDEEDDLSDHPVHDMPDSPGDTRVKSDKSGTPQSSGTLPLSPEVSFTLPEEYEVSGGLIANGTVTARFGDVTCTYRGGSPDATPTTARDLNLARLLRFEGCTDGLPANTRRSAGEVEITVHPAPGHVVEVENPMQADGSCADELPILTAAQTHELRGGFSWEAATPVAATNPDGSPALYYAWISVSNREDAENLRKLYIHELTSPLFTEELERFAGQCGTLTNPGDGHGSLVPAVIPGAMYNAMIAALTSDEIEGDAIVFDAVILREPPASARNANGSLDTAVLVEMGFDFLDYLGDPLPLPDEVVLDRGGARVLRNVLEFLIDSAGEVVRDIRAHFAELAGRSQRRRLGSMSVDLNLHALNRDVVFGNPGAMIRGWGSEIGDPLGAANVRVAVLQRYRQSRLTTRSYGKTNENGHVLINAVDERETIGAGICVQLKSDGAIVTDAVLPNEICDFRGFVPGDPELPPPETIPNFRLNDLSQPLVVLVANPQLTGLYQADDVHRYARKVLDFKTRRARITSGYWGSTLSPQGVPFAPCLGFPSASGAGFSITTFGANSIAGALIPDPIFLTSVTVIEQALLNTDIIMPPVSLITDSRLVMSHEYGHFVFCAIAQSANGVSIDHIMTPNIFEGDDQRVPERYTNEAIADFLSGQVAGGLAYRWLDGDGAIVGDVTYCSGQQHPDYRPCFDVNLREHATDPGDSRDVARIATLLHDVFDGHGESNSVHVPNDADIWQLRDPQLPFDAAANPLKLAAQDYGAIDDGTLERVSLGGGVFVDFIRRMAESWGPAGPPGIEDTSTFAALNGAMEAASVSWCDRCRVFALHSTTDPDDNVGALFEACVADDLLASTLGAAPEPDLRLNAATCAPCPDGQVSNDDGVCVPCNGIVIGNECLADPGVP